MRTVTTVRQHRSPACLSGNVFRTPQRLESPADRFFFCPSLGKKGRHAFEPFVLRNFVFFHRRHATLDFSPALAPSERWFAVFRSSVAGIPQRLPGARIMSSGHHEHAPLCYTATTLAISYSLRNRGDWREEKKFWRLRDRGTCQRRLWWRHQYGHGAPPPADSKCSATPGCDMPIDCN